MTLSKDGAIRLLLVGCSLIFSRLADKYAEKEAQKVLDEKVERAIIDACIKVGMLEKAGD